MNKEEHRRPIAEARERRHSRSLQTLIYGAILLSLLVYGEKALIVGCFTFMLTFLLILGVIGFLQFQAELRGKPPIGWFQQEWPWYLAVFVVVHGAALITLATD